MGIFKNIVTVLVVAIVFTYIFHSLSIKFFILPGLHKQASNIKKHLPAILADAKLLTQTPIFKRLPRTRNAQPLLNDYVPFKKLDGPSLEAPKMPALLPKIFLEHKDWAKTAEGFKKLAEDPRLQSIDTSWMNNLTSYDYWDYGYNEEVKNQIADLSIQNSVKKIERLTDLYSPDYFILSSWMAVHQIKLHQEQRHFEAFRTNRHLANLIHTTGISRASGTYVAIVLDREKMFVERLGVSDWETFPDEVIAAYKRLTRSGWNSITQLGWMENLSDEILSYMSPENGVCGSATEMIIYSPIGLYDYLAPQAFAEFNSLIYYVRAANLQEDLLTRCGVKSISPLMNMAVYSNQSYEPSPGAFYYFARKVAGMYLLAELSEDNTKLYDDVTQ